MSDEADRGNDTADLFLKIALDSVPVAVPSAGIGICINCGADVEGDRRWCGVDCRDDYLRATNRATNRSRT